MGSADLGDQPDMPLPLPVTNNVCGAVVNTLSLPDLAEEAALERVDRGVAHLVMVEEAGVLGQGALVSLVFEDIVLMTIGGLVILDLPVSPS